LERLTAVERIIAWRLAEGRRISKPEFVAAIWGYDRAPVNIDKSLGVPMFNLRRKLHRHGIEIATMQSCGWLCSAPNALRNLLAAEIKRNTPDRLIGYINQRGLRLRARERPFPVWSAYPK
jgi:hypothetical protein